MSYEDPSIHVEIKRKVRLYLGPDEWFMTVPDTREEDEKQYRAAKLMNWRIVKIIRSDMSDEDCWGACIKVLHDPQFAQYGTDDHQALAVLEHIFRQCKRGQLWGFS
jgi:hypothetical protein